MAAAGLAIEEIPLGRFLDEAGARTRRVPLEGTLETTFRCNLACVHCYVNEPAGAATVAARELSTARLIELIDEIAAEGCLDLLMTGGEVLLRADFAEVYLHARQRGLRVTVFTNGTLVTRRLAELFAEHPPACVEVSLYGMTAATYEAVSGVPGSFARCLAGIEHLHARGVPLKLKTMLLRTNRHELEAMRAYARALGVEFRHDSLLNPRVDCGANRNPELQLSAGEAVAADLDDEDMRTRHARMHAELAEAWQAAAHTQAPVAGATPPEPVYTCGAGEIGFTVDPYGRLQLCQLARRASFDVGTGTFAEGWHEFFPRLRARTWQSDSACRHCTLRPVCGSCPGAAELEHGDPEARVAQFCEITHLRAWALLGARSGHLRDGTCCRGGGQLAAETPAGREAQAGSCGGCGHASPAAPVLVQLQRRPAR
jgi:radical SAM protein with 4Fe4S-binding SPASM domain